MNLFDRIGLALSSFFQNFFKSTPIDPAQQARVVIGKQKRSLKRLRESITEMVFQRKKFENQLQKLENKKIIMKEDLDLAALRDKDELALRLMEELDLVVKEIDEANKNLQMIVSEIETAKQVGIELGQQIDKSESQLSVLVSRSQSVKMREELQAQFSKIHSELSHLKPDLNVVEESILKLESRLENLQGPNEDWKKDVVKLRKDRTDHFRKSRLEQLKMQLKAHQLPASVLIPEVVR